jgi:hypothetical protein
VFLAAVRPFARRQSRHAHGVKITKLPLLVLAALLAFTPGFGAAAVKKAAPETKKETTVETGYWITTKSQIRHNSKCRYYKNSQGQFCPKDAGRACKICGG